MKNTRNIIAVALSLAALVATAQADSVISVQFNSNTISSGGYTAGFVPEKVWNSDQTATSYVDPGSSALSNLTDSTGNGTGISENTINDGTYGPNGTTTGFANAGDNVLFSHGFLSGEQAGTTPGYTFTLNLTGLNPAYTYDLILYTTSVQGTYSASTITASTAGGATYYYTSTYSNVATSYVQATNTTSGSYPVANYVEWTGLTATVGTLSASLFSNNHNGQTVDGFQVVVHTGVGSAPAAPTGLGAVAGNAQVALSWTASAGATSYNVYRGASSGGESATPVATGNTTGSYTDSGLTNGTPYYYKVAAVNSSGTSGYSNEAVATPTSATYVLTVNNGSGGGTYPAGAVVMVTANAPATGSQFAGWTGATGALANASAASTTLTMPASATAITATYATIPAPSAPTGLGAAAGNTQVGLTWTASSGATTYNIYRGASTGAENATPIATGIATASYTDSGLSNGTPYYYTVAAVNSSGTSGYSNEASATPSSGPSLVLAVGLERIVPGYNGPAIRIQRPGDNAQTDIGFAAGSNALDTSAVSAFMGTNQGLITTLYAQDGSGHNVTAPASTDNMPTIGLEMPTSIAVNGVWNLAARNITLPYGPNGEGNFRYFILPSSVSVDRSQVSVFLAYRPDYSGGPFMSLYELGNIPLPNTPGAPATASAVDLMSCSSGFQGMTTISTTTTSSTTATSTASQIFCANNNINCVVARCQPTVVGLVSTPGSAPTLYVDGLSRASNGSVPTSITCSGGYLMAGNSTASYYGQALYGMYNFLAFAVYNGPVTSTAAAEISSSMLPRTIPSVNIVADGDSITQGTGAVNGWNMLRYVEPQLNQPADIANLAIFGTTSPTAVGHLNYPTGATSPAGQLYKSSYTKNIYYVAIGTNDIHGNFLNGAGTWNEVMQALQLAKAMGFKTTVATILHEYGETATSGTEVNNFNALARAAVGQPYLDGLVDYAADPRLGNINNYYPTYSGDGTHPNDAGYQVMSTIAAPVFNSLIGSANHLQVAVSGTNVTLTFPSSVPGTVYQLQSSTDLSSGSWENIGSPQSGTGLDLVFTTTRSLTTPSCFYRLKYY